ncbi:MAG: hypothetical protein K1X56_10030 [Flavobacteriales bacterium]|nr:hypothetical protein [Flavobacteriales bacterium]
MKSRGGFYFMLMVLFASACNKFVPSQTPFTGTIEVSPCVYKIPSVAIVVDHNMTANKGRNVLWVCSGAKLKENGGNSIIFLESGAKLISRGGTNTIYAKAGAEIKSLAPGDVFYYQPGVDFKKVKGGQEGFVECTNLTFDYSEAPSGGCN